jgi:hypothetical protein
MIKRYLFIILTLLLLLTSCSQKEELDKTTNQNEIISTNEVEIKETDLIRENEYIVNENDVEDNHEDREGDSESNTQMKLSQLVNSNILSSDDLQTLFNSTYEEALSERDENTSVFKSSFFKFTGEYPMISFNYKSSLYYLNSNHGSCPSYVKVNSSQVIETLSDSGYKKEMTLSELLKLDNTLQVNEIWTGYSDSHKYYVEVIIDEFRYALVSNDVNSEVRSIFISMNKSNLIDMDFKEINDLVVEHSEYNCSPLLYTRGDINNDSFEDIFITSVVFDSYEEGLSDYHSRVSLILFGNGNSYIKYGEVLGLIDSYTGIFGPPIVDVSIDKGFISISQYGGSAWRNNILNNYSYDEVDNKIYLKSTEFSSYHNVRPVQDTLQTNIINYKKGIDILDGSPQPIDEVELSIYVNDSKITYYESKFEIYVEELISKYRQQLISRVEALDVEGEFNINIYTEIANEKVLSLNLCINGYYNDMSKELKEGEFNSYYNDSTYLNIDLEKQQELNILDYLSVDEIAKTLFKSHMDYGNLEAYSIYTEDDVRKVVEDSLNGKSTHMNRFDYCFNDLTIKLVLYMQYKDTDTIHERESIFARTDDLIVNSRFYEEWFDSTFQ